jgi:hypothetical protein
MKSADRESAIKYSVRSAVNLGRPSRISASQSRFRFGLVPQEPSQENVAQINHGFRIDSILLRDPVAFAVTAYMPDFR